jgi:hypothetical protein
LKKIIFFITLFCCQTVFAESVNEPTNQFCTELITNVASSLHIDSLSVDNSSESDNQVSDYTCKYWPNDKSKIILAFSYRHNFTDPEANLVVAISNQAQIVATYTEVIEQDAVTYIEPSSIKIDTAKYQLSNKLRAFGLRINAEHHSCGHEGGAANDFRLFILENSHLKNILSGITLSQWKIQNPENSCSPAEVIIDTTESYISISPNITNGYHDLIIKSKHSDSNKFTVKTLKYNGENYNYKSQTN